MSGVWGFVLFDPEAGPSASDLDRMAFDPAAVPASGSAAAVSHTLAGTTALAARGVPGRDAGTASLLDGAARSALAFHGTLYEGGGPTDANTGAGGAPGDAIARALLERFLDRGLLPLLHSLRGEFTLAVWDGRNRAIHVASDRFRVHPVFLYRDESKFVFASHLASIRHAPPPTRLSIDPEAVVDILGSSVIPSPRTIYREIEKLPPGSVATVTDGRMEVHSYWNLRFAPASTASERALGETLRERLADAVAVRLKPDSARGRVGAFLSGGIDSSTVTGLLCRQSGEAVPAFSIGFGEKRFDEMRYARIAAQAFGAEHHEHFVTPKDVLEAIPVLLRAYDEPFANASAVPSYICAKVAREAGVVAVYAGDGGDELFGGNERYGVQRVLDYYHEAPRWLREGIVRPAIFALARGTRIPLFAKGKKYIERASIPYPDRLASYGFFQVVPMEEILTADLARTVTRDRSYTALMRRYYHEAVAESELDRQLYIDLKLAICDNDVIKVTRATEAAGIPVRYPFLDHRLAEFAATVPARLKMRGHRLRSFFKRSYADFLPRETIEKSKHGFGLPISEWLRTDPALHGMMRDLVLSPRSVARGYFRKEGLERLVERHRVDETSFYGTILWNLMVLELWHREGASSAHDPH